MTGGFVVSLPLHAKQRRSLEAPFDIPVTVKLSEPTALFHHMNITWPSGVVQVSFTNCVNPLGGLAVELFASLDRTSIRMSPATKPAGAPQAALVVVTATDVAAPAERKAAQQGEQAKSPSKRTSFLTVLPTPSNPIRNRSTDTVAHSYSTPAPPSCNRSGCKSRC